MVPSDVIEDILRRASIVDVLSRHVALKKAGNHSYKGLCPFHNDKNNPSLSVSESKGLYHCFSCGASGNALTFLKEYEKLDFIDALKELGKMTGVDVESFLNTNDEYVHLRTKLKTMHELAQEYFIAQLFDFQNPGAKVAVQMIKNRKLDKATIYQFGLGFGGLAWDGLFQFLSKKGFIPDEIIQSGLCGQTEQGKFYDRFRNRVTFPVADSEGSIIAFGGRALDPNAPAKYINSPETLLFKKGSVLYGWHLAKESVSQKQQVILVEGYLDVIRMFQAGFTQTVAPLGTGLTEDRISFLKNRAEDIIFCFDGDSAGHKSSYRSAGIAYKLGKSVRVAQLPDQDDPDTFLLQNGIQAMEKILQDAVPGEDFVLVSAEKMLPDSQKFLHTCFDFAISLEGSLLEKFLQKVSVKALVSYSSVELEFARFKESSKFIEYTDHYLEDVVEVRNDSIEDTNALELLAIMIAFPKLVDVVAEIVSPEDFPQLEMQEFYKLILLYPEKTCEEWILLAGNTPFIKGVAKFTEIPDMRIILGYAYNLRLESLKRMREELGREILRLERSNDDTKELSRQIVDIQNEIIVLKREFYKL